VFLVFVLATFLFLFSFVYFSVPCTLCCVFLYFIITAALSILINK